MARKHQSEDTGLDPTGWMLTYSDMVTLLLTFFVMIISITSIEPGTLADIDDQTSRSHLTALPVGPGLLGFSNPALVSSLIELTEKLDDLPPDISLDQNEIKAALFQLDPINSPDYQRLEQEITDSVSIFKDERGLVIRWNKAILFPEGSAILRGENMVLLSRMGQVLQALTLPVSVDSFTNPLSESEGGDSTVAYDLSTRRSKVVLEYLASQGMPDNRLRLGTFGGSRPVTDDPDKGAENSRLEIVIYSPPKSSWKG
ncbi:MAG: OmpA family protein [Deltaproteobacteria bacterium]|jgi:chemotaxis protein MotB|nr:OmpA family protein [Deltaproteobacteria bacterium]